MFAIARFRIPQLLSAVSLVSAAAGAQAALPETPETKIRPECHGPNANGLQCARAIERELLPGLARTGVARIGGALRLKLDRKVLMLYDGNLETSQAVAYTYAKFLPDLNAHLLHLHLYEGGGYVLVHRHTGQQTFLDNLPQLSPDKKHFLVASEDMSAGYNFNGVEVWSVQKGLFSKEARIELQWGPSTAHWMSASTAAIAKVCWGGRGTELQPCGTAKLHRIAGKWAIAD